MFACQTACHPPPRIGTDRHGCRVALKDGSVHPASVYLSRRRILGDEDTVRGATSPIKQPLGSHSPARASAHIPWASSSDLGAWAARTHSQSAGTARSKSGGYLHQRTGRARKHQHVPTLQELPCGWSFASVIACWCMVRFMYQRRHTTGLPATATSANVSLMSPTYRGTALHEGDVEERLVEPGAPDRQL